MMADAVEASSRSLAEYSEESFRDLVNKIIDDQVNGDISKSTNNFQGYRNGERCVRG